MTRIEREDHRAIWERKPALRKVYKDYYDRILAQCRQGSTLEIGSGIGNLKDYCPQLTSVDIVTGESVDVVSDAQALPFAGGSFSNIVAVDTLHHVACPFHMLRESARVLRPGGRLLLLEPGVTIGSWFFYRFLHPERVDFDVNPLAEESLSDGRDPDDANQAVATLLTGKYRDQLSHVCPQLRLVSHHWLSLFVYPLSGGFRPWSLVPNALVDSSLKLDSRLAPLLGRLLGFRLFMIIDRI